MDAKLGMITATAMIAASLVLGACYCAFADAPQTHERVVFASVDDGADRHGAQLEIKRDGGLPEVTVQGVQDSVQDEPAQPVDYYEPEYYEPETYNGPAAIQGNPDGLNSFVGVVEHGDHVETYYATSAVYDDQLTVDEQGFYRDSEGRYVVASSDHEIGEIIETSQGEAIVMDNGTAPGVVDMHVNWR